MGFWEGKCNGDINMITHAFLKVVNHIYVIVFIIRLVINFSVMILFSFGLKYKWKKMLLIYVFKFMKNKSVTSYGLSLCSNPIIYTTHNYKPGMCGYSSLTASKQTP